MCPISDLRGLSESLNKASDELTQIIKSTEAELRELNLGVEAWAEKPIHRSGSWKEKDEVITDLTYLGWAKFNGKWCLMAKNVNESCGTFSDEWVVNQPYAEFTEVGRIELLSRTREIKALAVENMENLFAAIKAEGEKLLKTVEKGKSIQL